MQEVFLTMMYERILIPSSDGYELPLDVYCPHVSVEIDPDIQRPAVVICPGGGYAWLSEREGEPVALAFTALGFNAYGTALRRTAIPVPSRMSRRRWRGYALTRRRRTRTRTALRSWAFLRAGIARAVWACGGRRRSCGLRWG